MSTYDYFAAYKLIDKTGKPTYLHITVVFRHDTDSDTLEKMTEGLLSLNLLVTLQKVWDLLSHHF